jgi:hypothetical protein
MTDEKTETGGNESSVIGTQDFPPKTRDLHPNLLSVCDDKNRENTTMTQVASSIV